MKDYYYILGVTQEASIDEIKKAYRKLSLKFHPDKNEGDEFFTERFKEIQEAYDILSNSTKRGVYDNNKNNNWNKSQANTNNYRTNFTPEIEYFKSNKNAFEYDEEITFNWKTINSDIVILKPFGQVPTIGQKTYKIKDFKNTSIEFELIAENSNIGRQIKSTLRLRNKTYHDLYAYFKEIIEKEKHTNKQKDDNNKSNDTPKNSTLIVSNLGEIIIGHFSSPNTPSIGDYVSQNGKNAPNGKYKIGSMHYIHVNNGKIVDTSMF